MDATGLGRLAGVASVIVTLGTTLFATALSPSFAWTANALSELGVTWTGVGTPTTVVLFNGGLVAGGLVGLGFAWYLVDTSSARLDRLTGVAFGITAASMGAVGVFPMGRTLHGPVAITFFLSISLTLGLAGAGALRGGRSRYGRISLGLAALNLLIWVVWLAAGGLAATGLAVPEFGGSVTLSAWVLLTVSRRPSRPS